MSIGGTSTIIAGIIVFLIGHWYLAKSYGKNECENKPESTNANYAGGITGIVLGIILMITGLVLAFSKGSISNVTNVSDVSDATVSSPSYEEATSIS